MTDPETLLHLFNYVDKTGQNEQERRAAEIIVQAIHKASTEENLNDPAVWLIACKFAEDLMFKIMEKQTAGQA